MEDVREVSEELHQLAEAEPLGPFDTAALLERGRRGRHRRRILGLGGAVAGVAAIALAAGLLPNLGTASKQPGIAQTQTANSQFESVPGIPRGEDGVGRAITRAEAERRCALRDPTETRPFQGTWKTIKAGRIAVYEPQKGEKWAQCAVPGGDKPSAKLIAAAAKDPLPTSTAGRLRNCSVAAWVDVTNWHVVAFDQSKALKQAALLAISPSGRTMVSCGLRVVSGPAAPMERASNSWFLALDEKFDTDDPAFPLVAGEERPDLLSASGGGGTCSGKTCTRYEYTGWGRVASNATKVRLQLGPGVPAYDVPAKDGWFAFTWLNQARFDIKQQPTITAYDAAGKVVRKLQ